MVQQEVNKATTGTIFTQKVNTGLLLSGGTLTTCFQALSTKNLGPFNVRTVNTFYDQVAPPIVIAPHTQITLTYRWNLQWSSNSVFTSAQAIAHIIYPPGCPDTRNWHRMDSTYNPDVDPGYYPRNINYNAGTYTIIDLKDIDFNPLTNTPTTTWVNTRSGVTFVDEVFFRGSFAVTFTNNTDDYAGFVLGRQIGLRCGPNPSLSTPWNYNVTTPRYLWNSVSPATGKTIGQTVLYVRDLNPLTDYGVSAGWGLPTSLILP